MLGTDHCLHCGDTCHGFLCIACDHGHGRTWERCLLDAVACLPGGLVTIHALVRHVRALVPGADGAPTYERYRVRQSNGNGSNTRERHAGLAYAFSRREAAMLAIEAGALQPGGWVDAPRLRLWAAEAAARARPRYDPRSDPKCMWVKTSAELVEEGT